MHRLGKRLIDLSREVTTSAGDAELTPAEIAVIEDVLKHPDSAVSEIKVRTGFAQSHVSESVARLRERGLIETPPDAADRRRTRVRLSEAGAAGGARAGGAVGGRGHRACRRGSHAGRSGGGSARRARRAAALKPQGLQDGRTEVVVEGL